MKMISEKKPVVATEAGAKTIRSIWADARIEGFRSAAAGYWKLGRSEDDYRTEAND